MLIHLAVSMSSIPRQLSCNYDKCDGFNIQSKSTLQSAVEYNIVIHNLTMKSVK